MSTVPKEQKKNLIANSVSDQSMIISYFNYKINLKCLFVNTDYLEYCLRPNS